MAWAWQWIGTYAKYNNNQQLLSDAVKTLTDSDRATIDAIWTVLPIRNNVFTVLNDGSGRTEPGWWLKQAASDVDGTPPLSKDEIRNMVAYWRAENPTGVLSEQEFLNIPLTWNYNSPNDFWDQHRSEVSTFLTVGAAVAGTVATVLTGGAAAPLAIALVGAAGATSAAVGKAIAANKITITKQQRDNVDSSQIFSLVNAGLNIAGNSGLIDAGSYNQIQQYTGIAQGLTNAFTHSTPNGSQQSFTSSPNRIAQTAVPQNSVQAAVFGANTNAYGSDTPFQNQSSGTFSLSNPIVKYIGIAIALLLGLFLLPKLLKR